MGLDVELDVVVRAQRGDARARSELLIAARPFVRALARQWAKRNGTDADDCEQEGYLGLLRGLERWAPARGTFGPWARWWVDAYARRAGLAKRDGRFMHEPAVGLGECVCADGSTALTWEECLAVGGETPEETAARRQLEARAAASVALLPSPGREIVAARARGESLREAGGAHGRTAEWARQHEARALVALRAHAAAVRAEA